MLVGSGITKVPEAAPALSVVSAAPADEPVGVTWVETSTPSKKGNILVNGFISSAVNVIVLGLINCANATLTTLSPKLVLTAFGTKDVLTPVLNNPTLCSVVIVVVFVTKLPCLDVSVLLFVSRTAPAHCSFQLFQTVPKFKSITPIGTTVLDLVKTFERVNNVKVPYIFTDRRSGDSGYVVADNSLLLNEFKIRPQMSLEDMCRDGWKWKNLPC